MPRVYVKKGTRFTEINEENMAAAIQEVLNKTLSTRKAAAKYGVKSSTLDSRIAKLRSAENDHIPARVFTNKFTSYQVFTQQEETLLNGYITECSKMHYGMTLVQVRKLAYEFAKANELRYPPSWEHNKMAGKEWVDSFRRRNTNLRLRKPENTSAARSYGFNRTAVEEFYSNLESVYVKYQFTPDRIYNFDESGISTVLETPKILADKKQKQIGQLVSAERGELVTFGGIISASGNTIPPLFIFPRVHFKNHFMSGAPEGSLGVATKSGWVNSTIYLEVLKHIQKKTSCSKDNPILLLVDNHESHVTLEAVNYARDNGIIYMSFPPHTTHRLQPLDVGIFGPFKAKLKVAFNDWHVNNPGKTLTIYNIPGLAKRAYFESFNCKNITSAFEKTGISPFNRLVFSDDDFAPLQVYNSNSAGQHDDERPEEVAQLELDSGSRESPSLLDTIPEDMGVIEQLLISEPGPSASEPFRSVTPQPSSSVNIQTSGDINAIKTPELIRPYPKIKKNTQNNTKKGRSLGKSRIYTNTPEKYRLEEIEKAKQVKKQEQERRQKAKEMKRALTLLSENKKNTKSTTIKPKKKKIEEAVSGDEADKENTLKPKKQRRISEETESEDETIISLRGSSCSPLNEISEESNEESEIDVDAPVTTVDIQEGCFVLIKFEKKKSVVHYVAQVMNKYSPTEYKVSFLRKKPGAWKFVFPVTKDEGSVNIYDVVCVLIQSKSGVTARTADIYRFTKNLSSYNVK